MSVDGVGAGCNVVYHLKCGETAYYWVYVQKWLDTSSQLLKLLLGKEEGMGDAMHVPYLKVYSFHQNDQTNELF